PQDEVRNTYRTRGRIALSGGGLRPRGPVGSSWFQLLARARGTYGWDLVKSRMAGLHRCSVCCVCCPFARPPARATPLPLVGRGWGGVAVAGPKRVHQLRPPHRRFAPTRPTREG